jgi:hypothetical protein
MYIFCTAVEKYACIIIYGKHRRIALIPLQNEFEHILFGCFAMDLM